MKLKAVLTMGIIMAVCILSMPMDESDAEYGDVYRTIFVDEMNNTYDEFYNGPEGYLLPYSTTGTPLSEILNPTCDGYTFTGWYDRTHNIWLNWDSAGNVYVNHTARYVAQWEEAPAEKDTGMVYVISGLFIVAMVAFVACLYFVFLYNPKD